MTAIACYKLHVHPQQKTYWILGIYLECIFGEHHMVFLQTLVVRYANEHSNNLTNQ